jgi:hypothetical protein
MFNSGDIVIAERELAEVGDGHHTCPPRYSLTVKAIEEDTYLLEGWTGLKFRAKAQDLSISPFVCPHPSITTTLAAEGGRAEWSVDLAAHPAFAGLPAVAREAFVRHYKGGVGQLFVIELSTTFGNQDMRHLLSGLYLAIARLAELDGQQRVAGVEV